MAEPTTPTATEPEESSDYKAAPNATAKIKNTGIRHRIMSTQHGNHVIESDETYELPLDAAVMLLLDHDEFELISVSGAPEKAVRSAVAKEKKARQKARDQRGKMLEREQEELRAAEEKEDRSRGN